jgi:hypothetical protein
VQCTELEWLWGDGTTEKRPCQGSGEAASLGKHTYSAPGIYYPRLRVIGWKPTPVTTDSRVVAVEGAQARSAAGNLIIYWGLWTLGILSALAAWVLVGRWARLHRKAKGNTWKWIARALVVLLLWVAVPPFSYLPNPMVLTYMLGQNYSYDPRVPFANKMMISGDPTARLAPKLRGLVGQTGLDPLDPTQPLTDFEFTRVSYRDDWDGWSDSVIVTAQMVYADGTRRSYNIPVRPDYSPWGFYVGFDERVWNWNDLNRVYAEHAELPYTRFANDGEAAPVQVATPQRLRVHPVSEQLEATDESNWAMIGGGLDDQQKLVLSPNGNTLLMRRWGRVGSEKSLYELWAVGLDGARTKPVRLTDDALNYEWSPDGQYVIYNQAEDPSSVYVVRPDGSGKHVLNIPEDGRTRLPGLHKNGAWFAKDGRVYVAPFDGAPAREVQGFSEVPTNSSVYPSPDGSKIAYPFLNTWFVKEQGVGDPRGIQLGDHGLDSANTPGDPREVAWSHDSSMLALVTWEPGEWYQNKDATLVIFSSKGQRLREVKLADHGRAGTPYWLPDDRHILLQTMPYGGRRIVLAEMATGTAWDLTRSRWDPWFAVESEGKYLVFSNGRGGYWRADLTGLPAARVLPNR